MHEQFNHSSLSFCHSHEQHIIARKRCSRMHTPSFSTDVKKYRFRLALSTLMAGRLLVVADDESVCERPAV